jgi:hypothetical protein
MIKNRYAFSLKNPSIPCYGTPLNGVTASFSIGYRWTTAKPLSDKMWLDFGL